MKLYDEMIHKILQLFPEQMGAALQKTQRTPDNMCVGCRTLNIASESWGAAGDCNLILRSEMAYELGGGSKAAVSGLAFTSSAELVPRDEILLYGPDLPEIRDLQERQKEDAAEKEDTAVGYGLSYARIALVRVNQDALGAGDKAYAVMRRVEYTRYHVNPKGYMMRISVAGEREPVRIGKTALEQGLDFAAVGKLFLEGYHKNPEVEAVKLIFVTLPDFSYETLNRIVRKMDAITESLNHIFQNLKMDCSVCNLKPVCDEVEGMKELHFQNMKEQ